MTAWPDSDSARVAAARGGDGGRTAIRVLEADPQLAGGLPDDLAAAARHHLVARTLRLDRGAWNAGGGDLPRRHDGWLGMLVVDGLLVRHVEVEGRTCCELLGPGDLLRPWDDDDAAATLRCRSSWRVLEPARLALLDAHFACRACRWPAVTAELLRRSTRRSRSLAFLLALTQARRADVRVRALFWHLADRWGHVTPEGVVLDLRLTHNVIAQLTGMRRPSVSLSLADLERSGEILRRSRHRWLIRRAPLSAVDAA